MDSKITVGDVDMRYRLVGEGEPLVMIIGFTANLDWWNPDLVDALSHHHKLLLLDNRGSGESSSGHLPVTMKQFAVDTAGLMDALEIAEANVLANSMGGMIAQELVLEYPQKVKKLVLNCTTCGGLRSKLPKLGLLRRLTNRSGTQADNLRKNIDILFPLPFVAENPETVDALIEAIRKAPPPPEAARRQALAILRFSTYRRLPYIKCPSLVQAGTEDVLIPPENSRILAERIPNSRLRFYKGGGHRFTGQFPQKVAGVVNEFLA